MCLLRRGVEGQIVVNFAKRMEMAVMNAYFKKMEEHRVMQKTGERCLCGPHPKQNMQPERDYRLEGGSGR